MIQEAYDTKNLLAKDIVIFGRIYPASYVKL